MQTLTIETGGYSIIPSGGTAKTYYFEKLKNLIPLSDGTINLIDQSGNSIFAGVDPTDIINGTTGSAFAGYSDFAAYVNSFFPEAGDITGITVDDVDPGSLEEFDPTTVAVLASTNSFTQTQTITSTSTQLNLTHSGSLNTAFYTDNLGDIYITPSGAKTRVQGTLYVELGGNIRLESGAALRGLDSSDNEHYLIYLDQYNGVDYGTLGNGYTWNSIDLTAGLMALSETGQLQLNNYTTAGILVNDASGNITSTTAPSLSKLTLNNTGTAAVSGIATLVAGTVTISTTAVTANSAIQLTYKSTSGTIGVLAVGTVVAGTSFIIKSLQAGTASTANTADTSKVSWVIIN